MAAPEHPIAQQADYYGQSPEGARPKRTGLGIAALVLGIIGIVFSFIPLVGWVLAIVLGVIGLGLGIAAVVRRRAGMNIAGLVLALIAVILGIVFGALTASAVDNAVNNAGQNVSHATKKHSTGGSTSNSNQAAGSGSGSSSQNSGSASGQGSDDTPVAFSMGQSATVTQGGANAASVTLWGAQTSSSAPDPYSDAPANGYYLTVNVAAKATGSQTFDINPFDFYYRSANGTHLDEDNGNAIEAEGDHALNDVTLNPGERVQGTLTFDVPSQHGDIVYAPGFDSRELGSWHF